QNVNDLARNNQQYQNQNQNNYYDSAIVASNRSNRNSNRNNRNVRSRSDQERYDNINARNRNNQINSNALNAAIQAKNVRLYQLKTELYATYNNLISNYSGILKLARTYPGSVPEDVDLTALQSDLSLTVTQRNALR
ncbi:MAG: hypothetical protein KAS23_07690, partial [Anaerohalosphaera sp.]|nr:hypothetical protein [Anaerohalosphaera sp.]